LSRLPAEMKFPHVYVHIPFCETICHYCDFYVERTRGADYPLFFQALGKEFELRRDQLSPKIKTLYFGGGTPSEAPFELIEKFIRRFEPLLDSDAEITLEANPTSIMENSLIHWRAAGVNRLSVGTQSLRNPHLKRLGRTHNSDQALRALELAASHISNVSADLIYGVPGMKESDAARDAVRLADVGMSHVSAYTLTLTSEHFLFKKLPSSNETMNQSEAIREALSAHGLECYEASNYARAGYQSRHNQAYWGSRPYLAIGPSAHGFDGKSFRWKNIADWKRYAQLLAEDQEPTDSTEELTKEQMRLEFLITRLRTKKGFAFADYNQLFAADWPNEKIQIFNELAKSNLGAIETGHWRPSFAGLMLADSIALRLA
jgi:oxygen-independent coproporphyrinogen-3 oxidase